MGESKTAYSKDKLSMYTGAPRGGIAVPPFTSTTNYIEVAKFLDSVPPPWVLKPRFMAGSIATKIVASRQEAWECILALGDRQSFYLLEQFVCSDILHVDSCWSIGERVLALASAYRKRPFDGTRSGGAFTTRLLPRNSNICSDLLRINHSVLKVFALNDGASHTEFIRRDDGEFLLLEISARAPAAQIPPLIETRTEANLGPEWAKLESSLVTGSSYSAPEVRHGYAGLLVSSARQEWPDNSVSSDPEVVWKLAKRHHVGPVVSSPDDRRVAELTDSSTKIVRKDFHATAPPR